MRTLADLKVGDTAVIAGRGGEVTVVKVARVYITVISSGQYAQERQFRIDNGTQRGDRGVGYSSRLRTPEEAEAISRRDRAMEALRKHGIDIRWTSAAKFSTETLEAILAVIPTGDEETTS